MSTPKDSPELRLLSKTPRMSSCAGLAKQGGFPILALAATLCAPMILMKLERLRLPLSAESAELTVELTSAVDV